MHPRTALETRLAEALMGALFPCDLGDGIEVVHDVEQIEIEMDCNLDEDAWQSAPYEKIEILFETAPALPFEDIAAALLDPNAIERSPVWDTLPFTPCDVDETVPYPF
jgi:hypothetical protein